MSKDSVRYGRVPKRSREKPDSVTLPVSSNQTELTKGTMYDIIISISEAHRAHCAYTEEKTRGLIRKPAIFGVPEYQGEGGVAKVSLWQHFAALLTPSIQQVVEFAKRIPGFQDLAQDDKLLLIKLGFFEVWLVHAARLSNPLEGALVFSEGSTLSRQQLETMFDRDFVNMIFNFVCWFNDLQLTDSEIALYSAVVLLQSEREGIYGHKSIRQLQEQMMEALRCQAAECRPANEAPTVYGTLISRLGELKQLGDRHLLHLRWFRANWAHLRLAPLFAEVFDIPRHDQEQL